ncbi:hypothetical protein A4A49_54815 [Nicotiana attenuata]|uniref:F-box associated beta-propeller type 1 domain-containing protein n=1 Tax=Nicotiana attenuata TaxID=49451 RepID=A0A314KLF0_NICAT|nr:hypothetical protein A4A49_54815 [Nicotiana attenuata]
MLKKLPSSGINGIPSTRQCCSYGFGYVECKSDYKVVEIVKSNHNNCYGVNVYSLRTNSWKRIQERGPRIGFLDQVGKFVNGKLHWFSKDRVSGGISSSFISSFDLVDETFGNLALPNLINYVSYSHLFQLIMLWQCC